MFMSPALCLTPPGSLLLSFEVSSSSSCYVIVVQAAQCSLAGAVLLRSHTRTSLPPHTFSLSGAKVLRLDRFESSSQPTGCTAQLRMSDGSSTSVDAELVIWTAGSSPVTRASASGGRKGLPFPTNARGSIQTVGAL